MKPHTIMLNQRFTPLFLGFITLFSACNEPEQRIARSVGATSEILVVSQNDGQWNGVQGEAVRDYFGQEQYGLPQREELYKLSRINVKDLSDMFKKHRNLLIIENNASLREPMVEIRTDLWAKPQRVIKIAAPDEQSWVTAFDENKEGIKLLFDRSERERLLNILRPTANAKIIEEVAANLHCKLLIPEGFYIAKNEPGFMWIRKETADLSQAFILYASTYRDTNELSPQSIISRRDRITQEFIPGPVQGSFMSTEKEFMPPKVTVTAHFITDYAIETRGIWHVIGDFMAGPFLSFTVIHPHTGKLLTMEGYVYAPNKPKRDLLRQLEAILYSLEFTD